MTHVLEELELYAVGALLPAQADAVARHLAECAACRAAAAEVALIGVIWYVNVPGMQTASKLITAMSPSSDVSKNMAILEELVARPNFTTQEVREQIISFASAVIGSSATSNEQKQRSATLAVTEMQKQVVAYPLDAREHYQLSYAYRIVGALPEALQEIRAAELLSPKKVGFLLEEGTLLWATGDLKAAETAFARAYELAPQFPELALYAAAGHIAAGNIAAGDKILNEVFGGPVDSDILSIAYYRGGHWRRLIEFWQARAGKPDASVDSFFSLAAAYYAAGDKASAIKTVNAAIARYPDAAEAGKAAIEQIQQGK